MKKNEQIQIVNYLKNYGFIFPSSEIYNGLANAWDYGPLGTLLKQNLRKLWWDYFITSRPGMVGLDSSILLNSNVWKASGHLTNFSDPLIDCKECKNRFRADHLIEKASIDVKINEHTTPAELEKIIHDFHLTCPVCGKANWTKIRQFNLMFKTHQGVVEQQQNELFLRPETAQGIFINFINIQRALRLKLPFGVGQIGKSFRNEITPGNFVFRTREFEQMEIEYFCHQQDAPKKFEDFLASIRSFLINELSFEEESIRMNEHDKNDLSHYSARTVDFEFNFPHGWAELWGLANRTDYDLRSHENLSKQNLHYFDQDKKEKYFPYVIEPSVGLERLFYALICQHYEVQDLDNNEQREILHLPYELSPYKICVLPLSNKLSNLAFEIYSKLLDQRVSSTFDSSGSIGKRYRRQDAIGTFYCITVDFETEKDKCVTIRNRDTMKQERIKIEDIQTYIKKNNGRY